MGCTVLDPRHDTHSHLAPATSTLPPHPTPACREHAATGMYIPHDREYIKIQVGHYIKSLSA